MDEGLRGRMLMEHRDAQGQSGARLRISWRPFILALGLRTVEDMVTTGFGLYWIESGRQISDKGDLSAYWREISSGGARCKEINNVGEVSTIWKSRSVGVLKSQDGCSTHILAHKLNLESLRSKISGEFLILIHSIP
ncbi:hypothetical protein Tco_1528756, partial [Tanacetum coccineum]